MVELGEHCDTCITPRLQKVIDGTDQGGISKAVNWQGGGGFRYYKLAPTLIVNDSWGNSVINPEYNAAMLAEALAKLEASPMRPRKPTGGSTVIPANVISSTSPPRTCPPNSYRHWPMTWEPSRACWSAVRPSMA